MEEMTDTIIEYRHIYAEIPIVSYPLMMDEVESAGRAGWRVMTMVSPKHWLLVRERPSHYVFKEKYERAERDLKEATAVLEMVARKLTAIVTDTDNLALNVLLNTLRNASVLPYEFWNDLEHHAENRVMRGISDAIHRSTE